MALPFLDLPGLSVPVSGWLPHLRAPRLRFTDRVVGYGREFFHAADRLRLEGIVSKRCDCVYEPGQRMRDWLKVKCWRTHRFVICGLEHDEHGRLDALLVGSSDKGGSWRYEGRVKFGLGRVDRVLLGAKRSERCC